MTISDWFRHRERHRARPSAGKRSVPDGVWSKCTACGQTIYQKEFVASHRVCPQCGFHYGLPARSRVEMLTDDGSFKETDARLGSTDALGFEGPKSYKDSLKDAREKTGLSDAVLAGTAKISGHEIALAVMDFDFIGGSMGSAVGEKVTRLVEAATDSKLPLVVVTASGGARMQEGMLSLMQMAKTCAAVGRYSKLSLPYISVLTHPTTGGVIASFAALADVIIAEPEALIGFAGPRVIEKTINQKLPKGFQRSEFMLEHGMIDMIVPRAGLKATLSQLLGYLTCEQLIEERHGQVSN